MTILLEALKDSRRQARQWQQASPDHSELIAQVEGELKESLKELKQKVGEVKLGAPLLDPQMVWQRFTDKDCKLAALDSIEVRTLLREPELATSPKFFKALEQQPDVLHRSLNLIYLGICYFARWREIEKVERLELLLQAALTSSPSKLPLILRWKKAPRLFSRDADSFLADKVKTLKTDLHTVLQAHNVPEGSALGRKVAGKALLNVVTSFVDKQQTAPENWCRIHIQQIWDKFVTDLVEQPTLARAAELLILSKVLEYHRSLREYLKTLIISNPRLGDPRVSATAGNWTGVKLEAVERLISWLADGHLRFFFEEVLPAHDENSARKEFWLNYIDKVINFQVALSGYHQWIIEGLPNRPKDLSFVELNDPKVSAFLMKFRGHSGREYIVIEFSEVGNAAYIYSARDFGL